MHVARHLLAMLILAAVMARISAQAPKPTEPILSPEEIQKLVDKLGSPKFGERESATRKLAALDDIPPALQAAAMAKDAETARRAKSIIALIMKRHEAKFIARDLADLNKGGFDRFVDRMVLTPGFERESRWLTLVRAAEAVLDRGNKLGYGGLVFPPVQWTQFSLVTELPPRYLMSSRALLPGAPNRSSGFRNCLVLSSDSLAQITRIQDSIVFINGDLPRCTSVYNSLVICLGDIGAISTLSGSVIICTGELNSVSRATSSLIEAKKLGRIPLGEGNMYINEKAPNDADKTTRFVKTEQTPFRTLKLFEPEMLGINVKVAGESATIDNVIAGSILAKAGLRKGDIVLTIGTEKWATEEEFRTLLRRKSVLDVAPIQIKRDGKEMELRVEFDDK